MHEIKGVLIICHGFAGSPDGGSSIELETELKKVDIACLRLRFTPYQSLSRQVQELSDAVTFCRASVHDRIILLGRSMGAAACLAYAGRDRSIAGLCLMAGPFHLKECFRSLLKEGYEQLLHGETLRVEYEDHDIVLSPDFVQSLEMTDLTACLCQASGIPILVIHGEADDTVSVQNAHDLFNQASEPRRLLLLPGVAHSFQGIGSRFIPEVMDWLDKDVLLPFAIGNFSKSNFRGG